jgi:ubiquitin-conjugating enzyme E2 J2
MASTQAVRRLQKEYSDMLKNPTPHVEAHPESSNILVWYFVIEGPPDSFYEGGEYLGRIQLPNDFPFKAPQFYLITPSGRFQTETSICLSYSAHHQDTWSPMWTIDKMVQGLLSFMLEDAKALGTMETDEKTKRALAKQSLEFNLSHPKFSQLFPKRVERVVEKLVSQSMNNSADAKGGFLASPAVSNGKLPTLVMEKIKQSVEALKAAAKKKEGAATAGAEAIPK